MVGNLRPKAAVTSWFTYSLEGFSKCSEFLRQQIEDDSDTPAGVQFLMSHEPHWNLRVEEFG